MKYFADNLKFLRRQNNFSQEQLAKHLGLNRGNIASYEKMTAEPKIENLLKICKFFNVEVSEFLEKDLQNIAIIQEEMEKVNSESNPTNLGEGEATEHFIEELEDNKKRLERFIGQSDDMQKILEGFRQFHKFKMSNNPIITEDVKKMSDEYEKLLELMDALLSSNKELIHWLKDS
ncbi:helix-turn-helix domain-containing protein [Persicobacter psychrovividus]|uniref:HTH cro/C1-type domain-containing protein n=1 Tax=Persicobacter psychrovividus TaxID=387638 RepID=A0ABN6LK06_9BACT|nr:hypothetical protein PEPS_40620 [Persicobacter psychrovividus]